MKTIVLTTVLFAVLAVTAASAQPLPVQAKIDFPFTVDSTSLPVGTYNFARDESALVFHVSGQGQANAQVLTRISAELRKMPGEPEIVFDKVGDSYVLSEIWLPGEDGYVLALTKAKHEHKVIKAKS